jgi:hypothetical protein
MPEYIPDSDQVDARLKEVTTRFGNRLSAEQVAQVRGRIERTFKLAAAMRTTPLSNADEPEIVFAPVRGDR